MNIFKLGITILFFSVFSSIAYADSCVWSTTQLSGGNSSWTIGYTCAINGSNAATKTIVARAVGSPSCQISVNNGYNNSGSCTTPNINPAGSGGTSGSLACEFGDPVFGNTAGCEKRTAGGGGPHLAYAIYKDNTYLMHVATDSSNCTVSGYSTSYSVSGNCRNFRIYRR